MNERIKALAEQAGFSESGIKGIVGAEDFLERFAELVAAAEREACAKLCEEDKIARRSEYVRHLERVAAAIRARGDRHD